MMKPILFNTEMVRAIIDGRKTQTRRVVKRNPSQKVFIGYCQDQDVFAWSDYEGSAFVTETRKPPYKIGDVLYVRETWQRLDKTIATYLGDNEFDYVYKAHVNGKIWEENTIGWTWRPSIHMPKEASRIFLKVTNVRCERLQSITEEECKKEGVGDPYSYQEPDWYDKNNLTSNYWRDAFFGLWDSTLPPNKIRFKCPENGWKTNPFVWVIEFEMISEESAKEKENGKI